MEREPIAIVGIGCRLPGRVTGPTSFWRLLRDAKDAIGEVPEDRWNIGSHYDPDPRPGKTYSCRGGFIEGIDQFDPGFFGISPREAVRIDPQQRMLLEVAWEALEDGGQIAEATNGSDTGVFIGISSNEYSTRHWGDFSSIDVHSGTGYAMSIAANRISYALNLKGPSIAIDTACSSALTTVHLACESLWQDECPLALAGGVNALLRPDTFIIFAQASMLAPDGRCKAFDSRADGFGRGEGAGLVVLKKLTRALEDGDRIYASIRATAVNQDGRSSGLTVPGQEAQEALIREACRRARVSPRQIQYVEAHGTGTPVGDPVEAGALGAVLGEGRSQEDACLIGSVKTNIGHLEAAAGIAGLIKVALALDHGMVPANLHFREPAPDVPLDRLGLRVPTSLAHWPAHQGPALASVNSFGFGGANAHAVLEEAPRRVADPHGPREDRQERAYLIPLSARSPEALRALAGSYRDYLGEEGEGAHLAFDDVGWTCARRRSHHDHRLAVVASTRQELIDQLDGFASGEAGGSVVSGRRASGRTPRIAFVLSGQGPQWWAMGRELIETEPLFRRGIEDSDRIIRELGSWSLLEELTRDEASSRIGETAISQPAIFAVQAGLAAVWRSWGIEPDALVGHSVGEVAAAHLAGALSFEDAVRVIFHRGRCMDRASSKGRMLATGLSFDEAADLVDGREDRISIAAINSPSSVTLSGEGASLREIADQLEREGAFHRFLEVDYAFHSPMMDPVRDELLECLAGIQPRECARPMLSAVTGEPIAGPELDAEYWWRNVRQTVCFHQAVDALIEDGHDVFLELAPHPVLSGYVSQCARHREAKVRVVPSLRRNEDERRTLLKGLAALYTFGCPVDWEKASPERGRFVRMPTYPWQHAAYWGETEASREARLGADVHPLLGRRTGAGVPTWEKKLDGPEARHLLDHVVQGQPVLPGAAYLEMAAASGRELLGPGPVALENVRLARASFLSEEEATRVQVTVDPAESTFTVLSRTDGTERWTEHGRGKVLRAESDSSARGLPDLESVRSRCPQQLAASEAYKELGEVGLEYGPAFQALDRVWGGEGEALGLIRAPEQVAPALNDYELHPALLDACLQLLFFAFPRAEGSAEPTLYLPVEFQSVRVYGATPARFWSYARIEDADGAGILASVSAFDEDRAPIVEMRGVRLQPVGARRTGGLDELFYEYEWQQRPRPGEASAEAGHSLVPSPSNIAHATSLLAKDLERSFGRSAMHRRAAALIDPICHGFIWHAFLELGVALEPGESFTTGALAARLGALPVHTRLLDRCLAILEEGGYLRRTGSRWEVSRTYDGEDPREPRHEWLAELPSYRAELALLGRCGSHLGAVLRGDVDPVQLLFPDGSSDDLEHLYQDAPSCRFDNMVAQRALSTVAQALPSDQTLRILEVGAGTGGITSYLVPYLPRDRTDYVFTDISPVFFSKAKEKFRDYPFIEYQRLDIETDPCGQGFEPHSFDVVLANHVLHATQDLRQTADHIRRLLRSGGLLLLVEPVRPPTWSDLVFGLLEGWWRFTDTDLREKHAFLSIPRWKALLEECGFSDARDAAGHDQHFSTAVILARGPRLALAEETTPVVAPADAYEPGSWLILADRGGRGEALAEELGARGQTCVTVLPATEYRRIDDEHFELAPGRPDQIGKLVYEMERTLPVLRGAVHLWNLDAPALTELDVEGVERERIHGCSSLVYLAQALCEVEAVETPRLWAVTRGAESVTGPADSRWPTQGAAWGLNRVMVREAPKLRSTVVDLGAEAGAQEIDSLCEELLRSDDEDEIALRGRSRYVHRLVRQSAKRGAAEGAIIDANERPFRLESQGLGGLDKLGLSEIEPPEPDVGEVVVRVAAAGFNFSDVMKALRIYPGLPDGPVPLGLECAGTIAAVGEGVERFHPGDTVLGVAPFAFGSFVTTRADLAVPKPRQLSFEEAATIPVAFLTSHYALIRLAQLRAGERVLIHSAAGGVGLAAIQIARRAGAEIFATAGTDAKREFLRSQGVHHVMDSRSLTFADEVLEITRGEGVDVVLNSLAGEAIRKGLEILRDFGRFVEIGKRDIYENSRIGLLPFRKNISFLAVDLDRAFRTRTDFVAELFQEVMEGFREGAYSPIPYRAFPVSNAPGSFRHVAQAKHLGKVVLTLQTQQVPVRPLPPGQPSFGKDATYLISGGFGGFGLIVAEWLVERGARHLVLLGRQGPASEEAREYVARMRGAGAEIICARADVSSADDVAEVLAKVEASMPPLRGVFHAAMELADASLMNMDDEKMRTVWAAKVLGAWNLHTQTLSQDLDLFVLFSSMSAMMGAGGQSNYAAANTLLDALASCRRARGLPALSISWGALSDVGFVARDDSIARRLLAMSGFDLLTPKEALALLGRCIEGGATHVGAGRLDLSRLLAAAQGRAPRRFQSFAGETSGVEEGGGRAGAAAVREALRTAPPEQRTQILTAWMLEQVATVLGADPEEVDVDQPLSDLGLDSLMAVELLNSIEGDLQLSLSNMALMKGPSVSGLVALVADQVAKQESIVPGRQPGPSAAE
jgi:acyl transferase domain-containing protein/NADPH:quinone reductase-like Zn-dependent oxidoreductase/acyl carrier protein